MPDDFRPGPQGDEPGCRLLVVEMVLPPGDTPHPGKMLDMVMLVQLGGQQRAERLLRRRVRDDDAPINPVERAQAVESVKTGVRGSSAAFPHRFRKHL